MIDTVPFSQYKTGVMTGYTNHTDHAAWQTLPNNLQEPHFVRCRIFLNIRVTKNNTSARIFRVFRVIQHSTSARFITSISCYTT